MNRRDELFRAAALFWMTGTATYLGWHVIIAITTP